MLDKQLHNLIEPVIQALGFELWAFECRPLTQNRLLLRIYIDAPTGVTLEGCTRVSREVGALLDVEDPIKQRYQLEVSSPGVDRLLVTSAHFERYIGHTVKIKLRAAKAGRRHFSATIVKVTGDQIVLSVEGEMVQVGLGEIQKANLSV